MKSIILILLFLFPWINQDKPIKILIIGDSISIGYFPYVKEALKDKAEVYHQAGNAQSTTNGLEKLNDWLKKDAWDIIQFNWGLWDMAYRVPASRGPGTLDKQKGKLTTLPEQYKKNLEAIVEILMSTKAKLIFVNTSFVPPDEPGRIPEEVEKYNKIAECIMKNNGIEVNDLYTPSIRIHQYFGLGEDNVHYTDEGYKELSKHVIRDLRRIIENEF